ncbi:MAG: cell division protein FtsH, partial [candidate division NC10 bacterium]
SAKERKITAYHEAGHALVAKLLPGTDPIHKVTIIPRGRALGVTQQLPAEDKHNYSKEFLLNDIAILYGGRIAEEIVFGLPEVTTGAMNDIERATELARKMVCEWGMSERMGPLQFGKREEMIFLGREIAQHQDYSEQTAMEIDREVRRFIMENYERAKEIVQGHQEKLHRLAEALLEREVLDGSQIDTIVRGAGSPAPAAAA